MKRRRAAAYSFAMHSASCRICAIGSSGSSCFGQVSIVRIETIPEIIKIRIARYENGAHSCNHVNDSIMRV